MMLVIAGIGLYGLRDLTRGVIEVVRSADKVYVELYTSLVLDFNLEELQKLAGGSVTIVTRKELEGERLTELLEEAKSRLILLLAPGDPFIATTHISIKLEAVKRGVKVVYLPSPSIVNAVHAATGLDFYKFCRPVTIVKPRLGYFPLTPYYVLLGNLRRGLHTLFLLDLNVEENYAMKVDEAVELLKEMERSVGCGIIDDDTLFVAVARAASPQEFVRAFKLPEIVNIGPPPHVLIVPGLLNAVEAEALSLLAGASPHDIDRWNKRVKSLMDDERCKSCNDHAWER